MTKDLEPYPEARLRDYARAGADAGVAAIPVIGGSLQVLADVVIAPSLSKRRDRWLRKLHELLLELERTVDGFDASSLAGDEVFVSAVADASRIAMGTHLEEKLELLKNCLAHKAADIARADFLDLRLFRFVEELTPQHIVVLQYMSDPPAWFDRKKLDKPNIAMGSPGHIMNAAGLPVTGTSLQIVIRDLNAAGLAKTESLGVTMTGQGAWGPLTTDLGCELLAFVSTI